jgi:nitroimidazol reductase NimA-like FMN-containing flavoprotein (pyridoxamine 5'-phosphate oxidase superfamily)
VRRGARKARYDRASVERVLDRGLVAHVAFVDGGDPVCIPMLYARIGDAVCIHGSVGSRAIRILAGGAQSCLTVTLLDGLVLARSAFEHSANYESVVAFGSFAPVERDEDRVVAFRSFTEKLLPGRWAEVRRPNAKELRTSAILALQLDEASVKVRTGPPDDDDSPDAALETWAGVLPIVTSFGPPEPSQGLRPGIPLAASVQQRREGRFS